MPQAEAETHSLPETPHESPSVAPRKRRKSTGIDTHAVQDLIPSDDAPKKRTRKAAATPRASTSSATAKASSATASAETAPELKINPSHEAIAIARTCLDDMKAEDIIEIDLNGRTSLADAMIIATGRVNRHVSAIADSIIQAFKAHGFGTVRVEGMPACDWVLIDTGDIIIHVFRPEVRTFYNLEKMWSADRPAEGTVN